MQHTVRGKLNKQTVRGRKRILFSVSVYFDKVHEMNLSSENRPSEPDRTTETGAVVHPTVSARSTFTTPTTLLAPVGSSRFLQQKQKASLGVADFCTMLQRLKNTVL
jgi:hypothetical protein